MYDLQFYEIRLVECTERHFLTIRIISLMMMQQLLKMQIIFYWNAMALQNFYLLALFLVGYSYIIRLFPAQGISTLSLSGT